MKENLLGVIQLSLLKRITFSEIYYESSDGKTIMGEIPFKEILFLDYRDTDAGSNPREYNGLKKANLKILDSLLNDSINRFRFLHSGIIVSLTTDVHARRDKISLIYEECCLTNGNQTRFIILIIVLLKLYLENNSLESFKQSEFQKFTRDNFEGSEIIKSMLKFIKIGKITQLVNYIIKKQKYLEKFNSIKLKSFLNSRIRIQINIINSIIEDLVENLDAYQIGTLIAEANNDTQMVTPSDIFGNRYKRELQEYIFKDFIDEYGENLEIEYRYGEIYERIEKVHILVLLRPIIPIGILTKEKDIYEYTNQRIPVYNIFSRLISKVVKAKQTVEIVSKLIPLLYNIRVNNIIPNLDIHKRELMRKYQKDALGGELIDTIIAKEISAANSDVKEIDKILRSIINYNIEHIFPVLIFTIRFLIKEDDNGKLKINIPHDIYDKFFKSLTEVIYDKYVKMKLKGLPTSLTTVVRRKDFYEIASGEYTVLKNMYNIEETDFISKNQIVLS